MESVWHYKLLVLDKALGQMYPVRCTDHLSVITIRIHVSRDKIKMYAIYFSYQSAKWM